ncbi:hypothetical protein [Caulobacter sp. 1776]|uniref:hypothetical protein n=1 Tax=Caulobacter sp. 1776 TaxID=3156420 RepID=UPI003393AE73
MADDLLELDFEQLVTAVEKMQLGIGKVTEIGPRRRFRHVASCGPHKTRVGGCW